MEDQNLVIAEISIEEWCVEKRRRGWYLQENGEEEENKERNKERKGKEVEYEWEIKKW